MSFQNHKHINKETSVYNIIIPNTDLFSELHFWSIFSCTSGANSVGLRTACGIDVICK